MSASVLIVSADAALLDDLLRLATAADVEAQVASDAIRARGGWHDPPLIVVGADLAADLAECAPPRRPGIVLVAPHPVDGALYRRAVDIGAQEVVSLPDGEPWLADRMAVAGEPEVARAMTIALVGGRGGAGASVLAAALGLVAARRELRTLLLDGDPLGGGIDLVLGAERTPGARWTDFADLQGRLSGAGLHDSLPTRDRLSVLSWHRGAVEPVSAAAMRSVLDAATRGYDLLVADLPRYPAEATAEVLVAADVTLMVVPAEVRATVAADRLLELLRRYTSDIRLVVRGPAPGGLKSSVIAESLRLPLAGVLPADRRIAAAVERGRPPVGRGPFGEFCDRLLTELTRTTN